MRFDAFGAYAPSKTVTRTTPTLDGAFGTPGSSYKAEVKIWAVGAGFNFSF